MKHILVIAVAMGLLTSCVRQQISPNVYSARQVGEAAMTYSGSIVSVRPVSVQQQGSGAGTVVGGVAGGALGAAIGRGNLAPTALGAIIGAVAGTAIEHDAARQTGLEYVIQLDNGQLMTVVQGCDQIFQCGEPVYVIMSGCGRSRVTRQ
jgi:outer membrane lipoprotein SlyB